MLQLLDNSAVSLENITGFQHSAHRYRPNWTTIQCVSDVQCYKLNYSLEKWASGWACPMRATQSSIVPRGYFPILKSCCISKSPPVATLLFFKQLACYVHHRGGSDALIHFAFTNQNQLLLFHISRKIPSTMKAFYTSSSICGCSVARSIWFPWVPRSVRTLYCPSLLRGH